MALANQGKPWTAEADNQLRKEFANGVLLGDIAQTHGRTYGGIASRMKKLGLVTDTQIIPGFEACASEPKPAKDNASKIEVANVDPEEAITRAIMRDYARGLGAVTLAERYRKPLEYIMLCIEPDDAQHTAEVYFDSLAALMDDLARTEAKALQNMAEMAAIKLKIAAYHEKK